jgi:SAM-dependent methyltransferase
MTARHLDWRRVESWERLGQRPAPSWYLDPLVAEQKRQLHLDLARQWAPAVNPARVLKTDVFEDAYGPDHLLPSLFPDARTRIGIDWAHNVVSRAQARWPAESIVFLVGDVRRLPVRPGSIDIIYSNSTLDHFASAAEFRSALKELADALAPGGRLIITVDNLSNPLYRLLRGTSKLGWTPFPLGYTTSQAGLVRALQDVGLEVVGQGTLIHNPRLVSTALFLMLRRLLGARADSLVRAALRAFAALESLPTRTLTACFVSACALKP